MLTLAILAGGKSQRMGRDKAMMPFQGEMMLRHIMERLAGLATEVIIVAHGSKEYLSAGIQCIPDRVPGRGALGGLYTALLGATCPAVAVIACDMPFISLDLLAYQRDILNAEKADVVVPSSRNGLEPLHGIYRRETCLPAVQEALQAGEQRLISWFSRVRVRVLQPEEIIPFDPHGLSLININTPDEFAQAEKLAGEYSPSAQAM